jgi:cytochrome c peroxidase
MLLPMNARRKNPLLRSQSLPRRLLRLFRISVCWLPLLTTTLLAQDPADPAWRQFQHALGEPAPIGANASHPLAASVVRPFPAIRLEDVNPRKYLLGSDLYHERSLSVDNSIGCFICHAGPLSGTDGRPVSRGVANASGKVNALTTFNAAFNFRQFWNGRSVTLADQVLVPIITEHEMANTLEQAMSTLQADTDYVQQFSTLYPDGITTHNLADAIAHFQRTGFAVTDTPFQRYLQGEATALSLQEQRGWQRFQEIGCASCHNGIALGGNSYQKLGALQPYYPARREAGPNDDMALHQLGRELSEEDTDAIVAFMVALNGPPEGLALERKITQLARMQSTVLAAEAPPATFHYASYRSTQDALAPAFTGLLQALEQVATGAVAHFDFVQFQHLELIRHARALQHPPSDLAENSQQCLQAGAAQLLQQVMALELPIADYLQAQAMLGVLEAHRHAPAPDSPHTDTLETLSTAHLAAAQRSLQTISAAPIGTAADGLRECSL